jgi:hypothetical protein
MTNYSATTIRLHPSKFWAVTKLLTEKERESLLETLSHLAEAGDFEALENFNFITLDHRRAA